MIKSFSLRMEVSDFLQSASKAKATVVEKQGKISQIFTPPPPKFRGRVGKISE